jgi:hypothetical protein
MDGAESELDPPSGRATGERRAPIPVPGWLSGGADSVNEYLTQDT